MLVACVKRCCSLSSILQELPGIKAVHSSIKTLGMAQTHGVLFVNQELLTGGLDG